MLPGEASFLQKHTFHKSNLSMFPAFFFFFLNRKVCGLSPVPSHTLGTQDVLGGTLLSGF